MQRGCRAHRNGPCAASVKFTGEQSKHYSVRLKQPGLCTPTWLPNHRPSWKGCGFGGGTLCSYPGSWRSLKLSTLLELGQ